MLFDSPAQSLNLLVEDPPLVEWEQEESKWSSPHHFPSGRSGKPDDEYDDTPSIQAAIDSGTNTVYLPRGTWRVQGELLLRGHVRHFLGCEARLNRIDKGQTPLVIVADGTSPAEQKSVPHPAIVVEKMSREEGPRGTIPSLHPSPQSRGHLALSEANHSLPSSDTAGWRQLVGPSWGAHKQSEDAHTNGLK